MGRGIGGVSIALLIVLGGCSLDRGGLADSADGGGRDGGEPGCEPGTVDLNGDPADGCECVLSTPPDEACNGTDDDCDGAVDEELTRDCGTAVGDCSGGTETCADGEWRECAGSVDPETEACGGGDEDCDGAVDEGCACSPSGSTQPCGTDVGACEPGMQTCDVDGVWGACEDDVEPDAEACDVAMVDEDCDGLENEGCECADGETQPCGTDVGECMAGMRTCTDGRFSGPCVGETGPETETCEPEMRDEDCDGLENEGCACTEGDTQPCTGTACGGMQTCRIDGTWGPCLSVVRVETCNGMDDDCNGVVDDGPAEAECESMTSCDVYYRSGGNTYLVCEMSDDWDAGAALCTRVGYAHVTVSDEPEETYLLGLMRMYGELQWWGGLRDENGDGTYADDEWMGPSSSHRSWQGSQPDGRGYCIRIRDTDGRWDDQPCTYGRGTVCESLP